MKTQSSNSGTTGPQALSSMHMLNLQFLVTLREALKTDPVRASYEYGIDVSTAEVLCGASDDALRGLSYSFDRSIFTLRLRGPDLSGMLQRPPAIRALFAAGRETLHGSHAPS